MKASWKENDKLAFSVDVSENSPLIDLAIEQGMFKGATNMPPEIAKRLKEKDQTEEMKYQYTKGVVHQQQSEKKYGSKFATNAIKVAFHSQRHFN